MGVERFNGSIDRKTVLCPRNEGEEASAADRPAASERVIAHRLAFHIEHLLIHEFRLPIESEISVDCEYNRHRKAEKTQDISAELYDIVLTAKRKAVKKEIILKRKQKLGHAIDLMADLPDYLLTVAPDIVVHRRQVDSDNLLVVEVKKVTNKEDVRYDDLKLKQFTDRTDYAYELGAAVVAMDDRPAEQRFLTVTAIYEDGEKTWPKQR